MEKTNRRILEVAAGNYVKELIVWNEGQRLFFSFPFNRPLMAEIKCMAGAKWHGYDKAPRKLWSASDSPHNTFRLQWLQWRALPTAIKKANPELNPYYVYDKPLLEITSDRPLYDHQFEMAGHIITRHYCIIAGEMGTGKTLAAIEAVEHSGVVDGDVWYVGPKSGVKAVSRDLQKWDSKISWKMLTYEGLKKIIANWTDGTPAPKFVVFDESSKIKNPTAQRSQAALHLSNAVRMEHGMDGYVTLMSGTPAPKTPVDWFHQLLVACPGFVLEGSISKFKQRLCLIEKRQGIAGGEYPHVVTWWDDENKCATCGELLSTCTRLDHKYSKSKNEVEFLYKRMQGLSIVKFKKDCLDLPDKLYEIVDVMPTAEILRTARMISKSGRSAIQTLTLLRELSDGFQYTEELDGDRECPNCQGTCKEIVHIAKDGNDFVEVTTDIQKDDYTQEEVECTLCKATGRVPKFKQGTIEINSPKDAIFIDDLDMHYDVGRYIVWGGFRGTIDRLVVMAHKYGWATLRVDGRGYHGQTATGDILDSDMLLDAMDYSHPKHQELLERYPRLCFVGHPQAGGMALTLTASPTSMFYSNAFSGEARMQATDRGHRAGMKSDRAHTIKDLIHLPSDQLVLTNLDKKVRLQNLTMGQLRDSLI